MNNRWNDQSIPKYQNIKDTKKIQGGTNKIKVNRGCNDQGCSNQGCTDKEGGTHKFKWCNRQMNNKHSNEKQREWIFKVFLKLKHQVVFRIRNQDCSRWDQSEPVVSDD